MKRNQIRFDCLRAGRRREDEDDEESGSVWKCWHLHVCSSADTPVLTVTEVCQWWTTQARYLNNFSGCLATLSNICRNPHCSVITVSPFSHLACKLRWVSLLKWAICRKHHLLRQPVFAQRLWSVDTRDIRAGGRSQLASQISHSKQLGIHSFRN